MKYYPAQDYSYKDPLGGWRECFDCDNGFKLECDKEKCKEVSHTHKCDGCGRKRVIVYID